MTIELTKLSERQGGTSLNEKHAILCVVVSDKERATVSAEVSTSTKIHHLLLYSRSTCSQQEKHTLVTSLRGNGFLGVAKGSVQR